jgi:hypothetical protein
MRERTEASFTAGDWDALRAAASDTFVYNDRRKLMLLKGDVELWVRSLENVRSWPHAQHASELIATAGDRLAIERGLRSGGPDNGRFEIEFIRVTEVDADGRLSAWLNFDVDDRAAAFREAQARFVAGEGAELGGQAPFAAVNEALAQRDWEALRNLLSEDFVYEDRRPPGVLGTLDRDGWIASFQPLSELAPDWGAETLRLFTWNACGRVMLVRFFGTREGGPFENLFLNVALSGGDRIERMEIFDLADADRALARFEELCAGRAQA